MTNINHNLTQLVYQAQLHQKTPIYMHTHKTLSADREMHLLTDSVQYVTCNLNCNDFFAHITARELQSSTQLNSSFIIQMTNRNCRYDKKEE